MWKVIDLSAGHGEEPLFTGTSFTVGSRDRVGLVGPNGAGKSTMLRILAGETRPLTGTVEFPPGVRVGYYAQQVPDPDLTVAEFFDDAPGDVAALDREIRHLTGALSRSGTAPGDRLLTALGEAQERFGQLGGWAYAARVDEVRGRLGIDTVPDRTRLGTLSGGEQARVMLARVLIDEPTVLLLDEPTNHLDAAGLEWLGGYLASYRGSLVVVTHDRAFLDRVATRVIELDGIHPGPAHYTGGYTDYRVEKQRRWQRLLLGYEAQEKDRARLAADIEATKGHALGTELATRNDHTRRLAKKVARKATVRERRLTRQIRAMTWLAEPTTRPPLVLAFPEPPAPASGFLIEARAVTLRRGARTLVSGLDLTVGPGERVVIAGANGSGKTTLLRCLAGLDEPANGRITRAGSVALLPQTHDDLRLSVSVIDFFRSRVPVHIDEAEAVLDAHLFDADQQRQPLTTLSAGELRRLLLAAIVNGPADVLLLDEPTNYLDFEALDVTEEALRAYHGAIVVVTHDAYLAKAIGADRRLEIEGQSTSV